MVLRIQQNKLHSKKIKAYSSSFIHLDSSNWCSAYINSVVLRIQQNKLCSEEASSSSFLHLNSTDWCSACTNSVVLRIQQNKLHSKKHFFFLHTPWFNWLVFSTHKFCDLEDPYFNGNKERLKRISYKWKYKVPIKLRSFAVPDRPWRWIHMKLNIAGILELPMVCCSENVLIRCVFPLINW